MSDGYGSIQVGDRVALVHTGDPFTRLAPGAEGTFTGVQHVDFGTERFTQLNVRWDDGSTLMLIPEDGDQIRKVQP